jgi:radical SAM protein with 4Fe4S-binding SPASM domain
VKEVIVDFFRLMPDCFLVDGARDGALYDVTGRRLFLLTETARRVLSHCERNQPLSDLQDFDRARKFLDRVQRLGLGSFDSAPAYVDRLLLTSPVKGRLFERPFYRKVDWSLTSTCDLNCYFCPRDGAGLSWQACQTCVRRLCRSGGAYRQEEIGRTVDQVSDLGVPILHLRGGNPLADWKRLEQVMEAAGRRQLLLVITTPGTGQDEARLADLCRIPHVRLNLVMFGPDEDSSLAACRRAGVYGIQARLLDRLKTEDLPFFVTFLLCGATAHTRSGILTQARERWGAIPSISEIYTRIESKAGHRFTHVSSGSKPLLGWDSPSGFFARMQSHSCLSGTFEISAEELVYPCAGLDAICGSARERGLREALAADGLYEWWRRSKEDLATCRRCALRLACADCAAAEQAGEAVPGLKSSYCPFDPDGGHRACAQVWDHSGFAEFGSLSESDGESPCTE